VREREAMVREQLRARKISDPRLLDAMARVPRHLFVPEALQKHAYEDRALSVGCDQNHFPAYVVGAMLQALELRGLERVLKSETPVPATKPRFCPTSSRKFTRLKLFRNSWRSRATNWRNTAMSPCICRRWFHRLAGGCSL